MRIKNWLAGGLIALTVGCGGGGPTATPALPGSVQDVAAAGSGLRSLRPELPRGEKELPAVLFSYLPIDDGMDFHIPFYLNALERTTSPRLYNIAMTDAMGPDNTFVYRIAADKSDKVVSASALPAPGLKEMTTNDPATLASAVAWAYSNYPGRFKAFSYLGHGGGYMGIATDMTPAAGAPPPADMMTVQDFGPALKTGLKGRKLDLIHLHACLMANLEAAYELRDVAEVLFASQDVVGANQEGTEKPTEILNALLQQPQLDPRQIARETVIRVNPRQDPFGYATASAIDLGRIAEVKSAVNVLSQRLLAALPRQGDAILAAYQAVPEFTNAPGTGQRDLWTFCKRLLQVPDKGLQDAAGDVVAAMRRALLHTRDQEGAAANGLSIFMPSLDEAGYQGWANAANYKKSHFARDTAWDEFIEAVLKRRGG